MQPDTSPATNERRPISTAELLDLFKHWDTRVSHQEILNVTIAAAAIGAAASAWEKIEVPSLVALALGSLCIYIFNLLAIRRFGLFQDNIFRMLREQHLSDWEAVVFVGSRTLGIRKLRNFGIPLLVLVWGLMIGNKLAFAVPTSLELAAVTAVAVPLYVFLWLYIDAESTL